MTTDPHNDDKRELSAAAKRTLSRPPPVPIQTRSGPKGFELGSTFDDPLQLAVRLADVCGTRSSAWTKKLVTDLLNLGNDGDPAQAGAALEAGLAFLNGGAPGNEIEAALLSQMFAIHTMTMTMAQRAAQLENAEHVRQCAELANKSARTFAAQAEALAKMRNAGKQVVEVVHVHKTVHVAPGAQAIVGDVHHGGGGGVRAETKQQSQEPPSITDGSGADLAPMWRSDAVGTAMHGTGGERQEAVPDAWGNEPRRPRRTRQR